MKIPCAGIKEFFPTIAEKIVVEASYAYQGQLILPSTMGERHFVGIPTQWTENPFGDREYTYHLNRMEHLKVMAEAYSITGDEKYAIRVINELERWIDTIPSPAIELSNSEAFKVCSPWRALETGIRGATSWPIIMRSIACSPWCTPAFIEKTKQSANQHMKILETISPVLWPNADHNHYLIEQTGLLSFTFLFPDLDPNHVRRQKACKELDRCLLAQCTEEGGQIEGSPSYHNACLFWFAFREYLEKRQDSTIMETLNKMFVYSIQSTRNCGGCFPIGDSHCEDKETLALPAFALYLASGKYEYLSKALHFIPTETMDAVIADNIFRCDDLEKLFEDYAKALEHQEHIDIPLVSFQKTLGEAFIRTGWEKQDISLAVICKSPVQNRHAHMDPGSIDFSAFGKPLIVDPGIYTYKEGIDRYHFKSTLWHNTVTINQKDAWEYISSWKYGEQKQSRLERVQSFPSYTMAQMTIGNYAPVSIIRTIVLEEQRYLLVIDDVSHLSNDVVDVSFNVNAMAFHVSGNVFHTTDNGPNVLLASSGAIICLEKAWYSPKIEVCHDTTMVRFRNSQQTGSMLHVTCIIPFWGNSVPQATVTLRYEKTNDAYSIAMNHDAFLYHKGDLHVTNSHV